MYYYKCPVYLWCLLLMLTSGQAKEESHEDVDYIVQQTQEDEGMLLCRRCGHEIASSKNLHRRVPSILSLKQRNDTIMGVHGVLIQLFENPQGEKFEVIIAEKADVYHSGHEYTDFTWFPGYSWRIALCPACGAHLGWSYESKKSCQDHCHSKNEKDAFIGLVLNSILSADFANTMTIVPKPKAFRSY